MNYFPRYSSPSYFPFLPFLSPLPSLSLSSLPPFRVGGSLPVLFPYNSEFIRNKYRGPYLGVQSTFWMVGRLLCGAFAWIIIPQGNINAPLGMIHFRSWRLFLAVSALPSILGSLLYFILPESPRYLLEVGKERKALKVLRLVYKINHLFRKDVPEYPVSTCVHFTHMYSAICMVSKSLSPPSPICPPLLPPHSQNTFVTSNTVAR